MLGRSHFQDCAGGDHPAVSRRFLNCLSAVREPDLCQKHKVSPDESCVTMTASIRPINFLAHEDQIIVSEMNCSTANDHSDRVNASCSTPLSPND